MMAEFRWIIMSLFLMLLFKFTAAAIEKYSLVGDEVTLSCENVTHDQDNCDSATWLFSDGGNTVTLFEHGKIHREAEAKSDRLSVTANCSLVIKKVTREDVGRYTCRQFRSGRQVSDSQVYLSVVTMTERQDTDRVIFFCSVWIYGHICTHTVKWLYESNQNDLETSQSTCSASVTFTTSDYNQKLKYSELLKCEVTDGHTKEVHQFTFSPPQSSGEKPGHDAATTATISSTTTESPSTTGNKWTSVKRSTSEGWWRFIVVSVGLAALIISVVTVNVWTRTKGNKTQMDENMEHIEEDEDEGDQERNMMAEFRWIIMSLFLMLLFKFTAAIEKYSLVGDEVTLSCENVTHDQDNCDSATWLFSDGGNTVTLFEHGKIHREAEAKSDRLSVTANCSLVIKKVTHEDVGRYSCRQFRSGRQVSDSQVHLSVVTMTERQDTDWVIFFCSVWTYEQCPHTVKWLYEGNQNDLETSQSTCSASVTFTTSDYNQKLKYSELLKCEVTDGHTKEVHQFTFSPPQSSGEKPGHDATTTTSATTTTTTKTTTKSTSTTTSSTTTESPSTTGNKWTSMTMSTSEMTNNTASENNQTKQDWWKFIVVVVGLAALIIITVAVIRCKRTKGNKTQMEENMADPEADVSYASISYTKNTGHKAKVRVDDDDDDDDDDGEGDAVTYSTVKAPSSSSAGASAHPRNLYVTINKDQERNMMAEFRWIIMSLFLMLLFKFTAATEKYSLVGDEVTLSCENVKHDQDNCDSATWLFSDGGNTVKLFEHGKIHREDEDKSDRLSVTANCSLVIKKVTCQDVGRYSCRQFRSGRQVSDSLVDVSVVDMTERQDTDRVIFFCSVWIYGHICTHTVKWLYEGNKNDLETSQSTCVASVTFTTSDYNQKLKYSALLKCEVTDGHTKEVHQFTFSPPQSSGEKPGHDAATAATISTTESPSTTGNKWTSVKRSTSEGTNNTASENNNDQLKQGHDATTTTTTISSATIESPSTTGNKWNLKSENNQTKQDWWKFIVAAVGLAALIIIITVAVIRCKRTKGNKTQMDENMVSFKSTCSNFNVPQLEEAVLLQLDVISIEMNFIKLIKCKSESVCYMLLSSHYVVSSVQADPEADVSYASISYTKNTGHKAKVCVDDDDDDDDEGDAVTYSTVKAPSSSSAGASADPRNLYATINKPTK
ncbi:uncharacterized protein LOC144466591 [Epinephelus lanceolatus]